MATGRLGETVQNPHKLHYQALELSLLLLEDLFEPGPVSHSPFTPFI